MTTIVEYIVRENAHNGVNIEENRRKRRRLPRRQLIQRLRDAVEGSMLQLDSSTWDQLSSSS
jgi:hypothetical protein